MESNNLGDLPGILLGLIFAVISISFGVQQLVKAWKNSASETRLVEMMHEELARMSQQNTALSNEIGNLQAELIRLSQQLTELTIENQKLQLEVSCLNKEIARLHMLMSDPISIGVRK